MGALMFLHFMFLIIFSVSSTQILKPSIFKLEENQKPELTLETKYEANPRGEGNLGRRASSLTQGKPVMLIKQEQPGNSKQPGKPEGGYQQGRPEVLNKPGMSSAWILQGKPGQSNQKGDPHASNKQETSGSPSQQGKPESLSLKGKPASPKDKEKPASPSQKVKPTLPSNKGKPGSLETSSQQGKPGSPGQQENPEPSNQQRKPRSLYKREERKDIDNVSMDDTMEIKAGSLISRSPAEIKKCDSIYKPLCGSDGKTYGNSCIFKEAKRLSKGKLTLNHEGKC